MNELYNILDITKQAHWKQMKRIKDLEDNQDLLTRSMLELRQFHPKMGAKKMYLVLKPDNIGRDAFIKLYRESGFSLEKERSYRRTTFSNPSTKYTNLTIGKVFTDINQIWTSDITYLQIRTDKFLYITFIMDVYSRRIIGYGVSENLYAEANVKALKMALKTRNIARYQELIHHSDKGTQYTSNVYTNMLNQYNIQISMCDIVYENTHIERVNGIIKNEYLCAYKINNIAECQRTLKKVVRLYNEERPHWSINAYTPIAFENAIKSIPKSERILLEIYCDKNNPKCHNVRQYKLDL